MTIQITPDELETFANKVTKWHYDCVTFILEHLTTFDIRMEKGLSNQFRDLRLRFEHDNPKPSWKDLL